jgi:hypothetical protein
MKPVRLALSAFILIVSTYGAIATGPAPSAGQSYVNAGRDLPALTPVRLCNGISKHTRTICCGTNPPAWCGKRPEPIARDLLLERSLNDFLSLLRDPILYLCLVTCVTVIYLAATAASARDTDVEEAA